MPSTDPVSSITNCYHLIVSYTDTVHSFIISQRTVEPTGSSLESLPCHTWRMMPLRKPSKTEKPQVLCRNAQVSLYVGLVIYLAFERKSFAVLWIMIQRACLMCYQQAPIAPPLTKGLIVCAKPALMQSWCMYVYVSAIYFKSLGQQWEDRDELRNGWMDP